MCFSATASFSVAAATAVIGLATLRHVKYPQEYFLAIVPLLFASQQAVEGVLWLQLPGESGSGNVPALSLGFLFFAKVLWPSYSAFAVLLIEPDHRRRRILYAIGVLGAIVSVFFLANLLGEWPIATIRNHSIAYSNGADPVSWWQLPYLICTCAPLLLSSHRTIQFFGAIVLLGFLVSAYAYLATYVSVWCFFAAAGSTVLYRYFQRANAGFQLKQS